MRFVLQRQLLISDMIFVAYELNLPLNMEKPPYHSQRAGEWSLIWAHDSRPIYHALTYIAVPLRGPHQPRYIGLTLYVFIVYNVCMYVYGIKPLYWEGVNHHFRHFKSVFVILPCICWPPSWHIAEISQVFTDGGTTLPNWPLPC